MDRTPKRFPKRDAILTCLKQTTVHPSAEWVYARLKPEIPDLSLGTVYRNLALFKEQGLVVSLGTVNGVERFDGNTSPHVHFICTRCGAIADLDGLEPPDQLRDSAARRTGGAVTGCCLSFTGVCRECLNHQEESA
ncbi:MAG: transcriptional repressor [Firmicutes bacterium]|nr:transcriptional repressor [Bacillota bacterium]